MHTVWRCAGSARVVDGLLGRCPHEDGAHAQPERHKHKAAPRPAERWFERPVELVEHVARPDEVEEVPAMHTKDGGLLRQVQRATWERAGQILARPRSATRRGKMQVLERRSKVRAAIEGRQGE